MLFFSQRQRGRSTTSKQNNVDDHESTISLKSLSYHEDESNKNANNPSSKSTRNMDLSCGLCHFLKESFRRRPAPSPPIEIVSCQLFMSDFHAIRD